MKTTFNIVFSLFTIVSVYGQYKEDSCPAGYATLYGDIGGRGDINAGEEGITRDQCEGKCTSNPRCCSFEYSPARRFCNLNTKCSPTSKKYQDFMFCAKSDYCPTGFT